MRTWRASHRRNRIASESFLEKSSKRVAESRRNGASFRNRANPVGHRCCRRIKTHFENLFTQFSVICQRPIREPEFHFGFINQINDAAAIERPESEMSHQNGDDRSHCNRSALWVKLDPTQIKLLPIRQRLFCSGESCFAPPNN